MTSLQFRFLKDVFKYTLTAFGGPQAHMAIMLREFVQKRNYLTEEELLELNALCQVLPGPASTQTITAIGYKIGGLWFAILTFLIWLLPSAIMMAIAAILFTNYSSKIEVPKLLKVIEPMALGFVAYAAYIFAIKVLKNRITLFLALVAFTCSILLKNPYVFPFMFPLLVLTGGFVTSRVNADEAERDLGEKLVINVNKKKVAYFFGILIFFALLGGLINRTSFFSLPVRLFENFYRNGALIFGGGQVLIPYMFTEFVELKKYLTTQEFLSGYALQQVIPGPVFSFSSFLGGMAMKKQGIGGQLLGSSAAVLGINLPGLILILFIVPFWNDLKKITHIKNSMAGVNAVSVGFVAAAFFLLLKPIGLEYFSMIVIAATFCLLRFTKIPAALIMVIGLVIGFFL
ncbi:chromate efflux transporter [Solitalea sp. MAHUQ-68]|uniref:Chromate efflux transporter n=1 Tax=Solitalea agri TaxID=2953739 RepID=A0A9X2JB13_9SPHI|nr:chromate efflux transporter [Solitalea agri]MCO4291533.1 chromate efflux transporter [Solitalea agri]